VAHVRYVGYGVECSFCGSDASGTRSSSGSGTAIVAHAHDARLGSECSLDGTYTGGTSSCFDNDITELAHPCHAGRLDERFYCAIEHANAKLSPL